MELKKTTALSAIVWVAGILAEIIFHDSLSESIPGIISSIVIAVIVIVATYFIADGINSIMESSIQKADEEQRGYQKQLLQQLESRIDEQIRLGQNIYDKLDDIIVISRGYMERAAEAMFTNSGSDVDGLSVEQPALADAVEEIKEHTLNSAKVIASYQIKNTKEIKETLDLILDELSGTDH